MSNAQVKGERNYGIELFRIFSMLMIVILHINMNGGLMGCFPNVDAKYTTLWFGETNNVNFLPMIANPFDSGSIATS